MEAGAGNTSEREESRRIINPGYQIGMLKMPTPGRFETTVTMAYVQGEPPPEISIRVVHNQTMNGEAQCKAGQVLHISPQDNTQLIIALDPGYCPVLN